VRSVTGRRSHGSLIAPQKVRIPVQAVLGWRWVTGLPLGERPPGDGWQDRARRAGWRHGPVVVLIAWLVVPLAVEVGAAPVVVAAAWWGWRRWRPWLTHPLATWEHHRKYVKPLHARLLEAGVRLQPRRPLEVPVDRSEATVRLEHAWAPQPGHLDALALQAAATLAMGDTSVHKHLSGRRRYVTVRPLSHPPGELGLSDVMADIRKAQPWEIIAGRGRSPDVLKWFIAGSSANPHGLFNGPSLEAGKSSFARLVASQFMRHGGVVVILDPAWLSHPWAATFRDGNLDAAVVVRKTEEIAAMLLWLKDEMDRRLAIGVYGQRRTGAIEADLGVKILAMFEEMNSLMVDLKDYPEAQEALLKLVCRGRHMGIHIAILSQRAEARTLCGKHGGQIRENLGWKFLGRGTTPATLRFMAEGLPYPPGGIHGPLGRYGAVIGRVWTDVQVAYATEQECWDLATSGRVGVLPSDMPLPTPPELPTATAVTVTGPQPAQIHTAKQLQQADDQLVSVREYAAGHGLTREKVHALRDRWRDRGWPEMRGRVGTTEQFYESEITAFLESRGLLQDPGSAQVIPFSAGRHG